MLISIIFSNHCDMDCSYCCITNKNTSPVLSLEKAIDHINKYATEGSFIEFFGGEPTLHFEEIKTIMEMFPQYKYRIFTNGNFPVRITNDEIWNSFEEILFSMDGPFDLNVFRTKDVDHYNHILNNLKTFISRNLPVGLGLAIASQKQWDRLHDTVKYFQSIGVRYFSFEPVTVVNDDNPKPLSKKNALILIDECIEIIEDLIIRNIDGCFNIPKELMNTEDHLSCSGKSCLDTVKAISPRGNIYPCRDFAANEEADLKRESIKVIQFHGLKTKAISSDAKASRFNVNNGVDHLRKHEDRTPCLVKAAQYSEDNMLDSMWWLDNSNAYSVVFATLVKSQDVLLRYMANKYNRNIDNSEDVSLIKKYLIFIKGWRDHEKRST